MKSSLFLIIAISCIQALGQDQFTDPRDGENYRTITINDLVWMQEHLRFQSPGSWCQKFPDSEACKFGNYYFPADLVDVCPQGWRIPTWNDYHETVKFLIDSLKIDSATFEYERPGKKRKRVYNDIIRGIDIIQGELFFDMEETGWIQGFAWEPQDQTTIWVNDSTEIYQPHIHIRSHGSLMHAHKHSVVDKAKKLRRFNVRCVCDSMD